MDQATPRPASNHGSDPTHLMPDAGTVTSLWSQRLATTPGEDPTVTIRGTSAPGTAATVTIKAHSFGGGPADTAADFQLIDVLGEGGMGVVYAARQTAIDRTVAVKMLRGAGHDAEARERFLAEAVVTGGLQHPNIVPVHDLGSDADGALFFAMKRVDGRTWRSRLHELSLREHLDVLLRVCDAVAFAHSQGVIHRDLKPGNVMLGGFGEVLVMDWGLAVGARGRGQSLADASALAGTPSYMAPEMAAGTASAIGEATDVYLLGACLWEVLTGRPPHLGVTRQDVLLAAFRNRIADPADETPEGELHAIARRAMATRPEDRFAGVQALQQALRDHLDHAESLRLAELARGELAAAGRDGDDERFQRARHGFEQALALWPEHAAAAAGAAAARAAYAERALARGDLDLAATLVAPLPSSDLAGRIAAARDQRARRERRARNLGRLAAVLAAALLLGGLASYVLVRGERDHAAAELARRLELERERDGRAAAVRAEAEAAMADGRAAAAGGDVVAAQAAFRRALFLVPGLEPARDGMRRAVLAHADRALAAGAWEQAREKVAEAAQVGLAEDERARRLAAIDAAAGARRAHIGSRVAALMADAAAAQPQVPLEMARSELIALADPHTAALLLARLDDPAPACRRLAIDALAWMGGPAAVAPLLARISGPGAFDEQAAAFAAVCALAPQDASVFHSLRNRLNEDGLLERGPLWQAVAPAWKAYAAQVIDAVAQADARTSSPVASRDYGLTYHELGRWQPAERWLAESYRLNPENALQLHLLVRVRLALGDTAGAADAADRLIAQPGLKVHGLLQRLQVWRRLDDRTREDADLAAATDAAPSDPAVHAARAETLARRGDAAGALRALDRALDLLPSDDQRRSERARLRLALGDAAGALDDLQRADRLVAGRADLLALRAQARWRLRDPAGVERDAGAALRLAPGLAEARAVQGLARAARGDAAGARDSRKQLVQVAAADPAQHAIDALLATDPAAALAAWDRACAADPPAEWLAERAAVRAAAGDRDGAAADIAAACAARPLSPALRGRRGALRLDAGDAAGCLDDLRAAVAGEPGHHRHWTNLGWALGLLGRDGEALAVLDRAVALAPDDDRARIDRAVLRERAGDPAGVRADIDALLLRRQPTVQALRLRARARSALGDAAGAAADTAAADALAK